MRILWVLLILGACANTLTPEPQKLAPEQPTQGKIAPPPVKKTPEKPPEKPITIIVTPPAKPICVPLAVDKRRRIIQALECIVEDDKPTVP